MDPFTTGRKDAFSMATGYYRHYCLLPLQRGLSESPAALIAHRRPKNTDSSHAPIVARLDAILLEVGLHSPEVWCWEIEVLHNFMHRDDGEGWHIERSADFPHCGS